MTVSALRTIVVGPTNIYGVLPVQPALRWPVAEPNAALDYSVDAGVLLTDVADTIASATFALSPSGAGEMVPSNLVVAGAVVTATLTAGLPGRVYTARITCATAASRTFEFFIAIQVDPAGAAFPLPAPPSEGYGTALNWS